jgi:hypothetical protein
MNTKLRYECNECSEIHDDSYDAAHCCPRYDEVYECGHCHKMFGSSEDAADKCCSDVDEDALPIITHAELEAAGQLTLSYTI